jgi:hypothetical protein
MTVDRVKANLLGTKQDCQEYKKISFVHNRTYRFWFTADTTAAFGTALRGFIVPLVCLLVVAISRSSWRVGHSLPDYRTSFGRVRRNIDRLT